MNIMEYSPTFKVLSPMETDIRPPRTPAKWIDNPKYEKITKLTISCGGGVGGSRWDEYVKRDVHTNIKVGDVEMVKYTRYDEKEVVYNPSYIVRMEDYTLITAMFDSQNPNFKKGIYVVRYLAEDGHNITLHNA